MFGTPGSHTFSDTVKHSVPRRPEYLSPLVAAGFVFWSEVVASVTFSLLCRRFVKLQLYVAFFTNVEF